MTYIRKNDSIKNQSQRISDAASLDGRVGEKRWWVKMACWRTRQPGSKERDKPSSSAESPKFRRYYKCRNLAGNSGKTTETTRSGVGNTKENDLLRSRRNIPSVSETSDTEESSTTARPTNIESRLSRASTLSSADIQYLTSQVNRSAATLPPPVADVDWDAFAGVFEPARSRLPTRYPVPPLTNEQLDELAGAFAPPARAPRVGSENCGYR